MLAVRELALDKYRFVPRNRLSALRQWSIITTVGDSQWGAIFIGELKRS